MQYISIKNYDEWLLKARECLYAERVPQEIIWQDDKTLQNELFNSTQTSSITLIRKKSYSVTKHFFALAKNISYLRVDSKWALLYQLLWRLTHGEKNLLEISSDPLVCQLLLYQKAVSRDAHKMKAFVRFRCYQENNIDLYVAWHEPDHYVLPKVAPFFARRFSDMHWIIITPDDTAVWDRNELRFLAGIQDFKHQRTDELDNLWRTYYRAIFNPARIKLNAMRREMPVRYWKNLPETEMIPQILKEAPTRVAEMLKYSEGIKTSASDYFPKTISLSSLKEAAFSCKACTIYQCAKQTVFGKGGSSIALMIVAEQPGQHEDALGKPLIGASGQYLRHLLNEHHVDLEHVYFTNAVKHFKHKMLDKKIIYQTPNIKEINACKPWLQAEIALCKPQAILTLGLVAAKSIINAGFYLKAERHQVHHYQEIPVIATYHPAAILRSKVPASQKKLADMFKSDLIKALQLARLAP